MKSKTEKTFLAIIPARGGSKRLPDKNVLPLHGKPLIAWTIEAAKESKYITQVIVSTDNSSIADHARSYDCEVPFLRPPELSTDTASSYDVVKHAIDFYVKTENKNFDFIVLLQPTSPLRDKIDIDSAIEFLLNKNANAIVSVCPVEHSPLLSNTIPNDKSLVNFLPKDVKNKRSQDFPVYYRVNGAIYICSVPEFIEEKTFYINDNIFAYFMDNEKSVDIDTKLDFIIASAILSSKHQ